MRFAVHYNKSFRYMNEVDEVIFTLRDIKYLDNLITEIPNILNCNQEATINLAPAMRKGDQPLDNFIPYLMKLKETHENIKVQLEYFVPFVDKKQWTKTLKAVDIRFMYHNYFTNANYLKVLREELPRIGMMDEDYEPFEVYIAEDLGFSIGQLSYQYKLMFKFRMFPDIVQSVPGTRETIPSIQDFWIRPEDLIWYNQYVDTFELLHRDDKLSVVYKIYSQQKWDGELKYLIMDGEDLDVLSYRISPDFGFVRCSCRKQCILGDGKCNYCEHSVELAKKIGQAGLTYTYQKQKKELTQEEKKELIKQYTELTGEEKYEPKADEEPV